MVIGLMGGVGSGKSTVLDYLEENYGAYIIQSDHVAKEIMTPGFKVFDKLSKAFPEVIENGKISSEKLASIVFNDKDKLDTLNSITHPGTIEEILNRIEQSNNSIIVVEKSEEIISNQPSDEEYNHFADEFIDNTFSVEKTREQIDMILSNKEC